MSQRWMLIAGLLPLATTACPLQLDAEEHHGQSWQREVVGAHGYFAGNPTMPFDITDEDGKPVWGGACLCAGTHLIYLQFRNGEIPANEATDEVDERIDFGAQKTCEHYAEMASMVSNNCDEAVAELTEPPIHRGSCSFWADSDFCEIEFDDPGGETMGGPNDGMLDMPSDETETGATEGGAAAPS